MQRLIGLAGIGLFVLVLAEIAVFLAVAHWLGVGLAVLLLLVTSLVGGWLLRREGGRVFRRLREADLTARDPGRDVGRGLGGIAGGLLLAVPGFVTDVVGLALLVPPVRRAAGGGVRRIAERRMPSSLAGEVFGPRRVRVRAGRPRRGGVRPGSPIEGEIIEPR